MRWLVLVAIAASAAGCKQLLGFDDPTRAPADSGGDSSDGAAAGCTMHAQCASDACLPDGTCGDDTNVAYVAASGAGTTCTMVAPCATFAAGLATARPYLKVTGTIPEIVNIATAVTVLADPGAKVTALSGNTGKPTVQISSSIAVAIYDLEISGSQKAGIQISFASPTVTLQRVVIANNTGMGIQANSGTVDVFRSVIEANTGGGVELAGARFDLENDFIVDNGTPTAPFGGVVIASPSTGTLAFDTIADNLASSNSVAGVQCVSSVAPQSTLANDIIYDNAGDEISNNGSACTFTYSDIGPDGSTGTGVVDVAPMFVSSTDFHLQSTSPCIDVADPAATLAIDFDGQTRPYGAASDMGADEYVP